MVMRNCRAQNREQILSFPSLLYGKAPLTVLSFEEKEDPYQERTRNQSQGQKEGFLSEEVPDYERAGWEEESRGRLCQYARA